MGASQRSWGATGKARGRQLVRETRDPGRGDNRMLGHQDGGQRCLRPTSGGAERECGSLGVSVWGLQRQEREVATGRPSDLTSAGRRGGPGTEAHVQGLKSVPPSEETALGGAALSPQKRPLRGLKCTAEQPCPPRVER